MADDLERLDPAGEMPAEETYLPAHVVEILAGYREMSAEEVARVIAHAAIAAAAKTPSHTPGSLLHKLADSVAFSDETWEARVRPEVRRLWARTGESETKEGRDG